VTPRTVLAFDFHANTKGYAYHIGFINNTVGVDPLKYFRLAGSVGPRPIIGRFSGLGWIVDYMKGPGSYVIPVGKHFVGPMQSLCFGNVTKKGSKDFSQSTFSNIRVYEADEPSFKFNPSKEPFRMVEPSELVKALATFEESALAGRHVLVTAGPTYEDIDPVRFIGNRSSGRMGFAVAQAAREAGARVSLVAGPVSLETPHGVERTDVRSARDMYDVALDLAVSADVFISVAAVADYRPARPAAQKLKKGLPKQKIELVANPDIVSEVAALEPGPFTVGFAAETEKLKEHALAKLSRKRLDMIAANRVGQADSGFASDQNEILLLTRSGEHNLGKGSKRKLARLLIEEVASRLKDADIESHSDQNNRPATGN
jgi:hypothetical protein